MSRVLDVIHNVLKVTLSLLVAGLLIPVTAQILSRFIDVVPRYIWTEEIARFCFVWMIMVGAMCAVRDGTHFDLEVLPESSNPKIEAAKRIFVHVMVLVVALIFMWYGWRLMLFGWYQKSEIAALPMNWMFVAWPLSGIIFALFIFEKIAKEMAIIRGKAA
ncbi:MAG: TRAP transporter small permease [Mesorhizobium sp.]|uniref:TRAP transporter small permease n=1 Tax=unclassified Mesorhizobium TaxID=325217 RepID=UPI000FCAB441|nr:MULTISPECIES: TRAP transporter small permease [unclassified Mesorhizobium]RUV68980.1 TRAP transporter small permease [Mesorhizobium sp. M5C.F.Cr.IN.023.01.1.1]RWF87000.1 MAG: TRAP transporter small permease [Mesorhizobium sp.]RWF87841.1 MAG: TRAP transporter small permease [Mesorhizobium sp.]RWI32087.1 MAG: TRAP transporter small permease [Mesorhizobium sp.]RWI42813.1 MAG: TRAP transporter small permease [Mesorhizobium sp.]